MRIISRKVVTQRSREEVLQILKGSCSRFRTGVFIDNTFRIAFPARWHTQFGLITVEGTVASKGSVTEVTLHIEGGFTLYVGMVLIIIGILVLIYNLATGSSGFFPSLGCFSMGVLIYVIDLFDGIVCLDSLEHRLTRGT